MSLWRTCKKHYIGRDTSCPVCRIAELEADLRNEQAQSADTIVKLKAQVDALAIAARAVLVAPDSDGAIDEDSARAYLATLVNKALEPADG